VGQIRIECFEPYTSNIYTQKEPLIRWRFNVLWTNHLDERIPWLPPNCLWNDNMWNKLSSSTTGLNTVSPVRSRLKHIKGLLIEKTCNIARWDFYKIIPIAPRLHAWWSRISNMSPYKSEPPKLCVCMQDTNFGKLNLRSLLRWWKGMEKQACITYALRQPQQRLKFTWTNHSWATQKKLASPAEIANLRKNKMLFACSLDDR